MTRAVGYTRLSRDSDTSIDHQKDAIRGYADANGFDLLTIYDDGEHASGYNTEREEYQELVDDVRSGEIDAVIVRDTTRLGRDYDDRQLLQIHMRKQGVELHDTNRGEIDIHDEFLAGVEGIRAAADDQRKRLEIEKSKEAVEKRQENGCFHGTPPYGLRFASDKCHLERDAKQWENLTEILERREQEDKVTTIADDVGVSTATVSRIANRGKDWYEQKLAEYGRGT